MNRKSAWILLAGAVLLLANLAAAQFKPEEIADWPKWEEFLGTAKITADEKITGPSAVTKPIKLTLEKDGFVRSGAWKNIDGRVGGYLDSWKYEIAAYRMDRLIGLGMVPPTVERRFQENKGSLQLWADSQMSLKKKNDDKIPVPSFKVYPYNLASYLQRAFDNLIGNEDRHADNILISNDWGLYLIDHSRSFRSTKKFTDKLIYRQGGKEGDKLMLKLPRKFVEALRGLTDASIREAVGEYLTGEETAACLKRRDLILQEVERLVQLNGEAETLY